MKMDYEVKANKFSLKCIIYSLAACWFVLFFNEIGLFIFNKLLVRKAVLSTSIVFIITIIAFKFISLDKAWVKYILITVELIGIYIMCTFLTYHITFVLGLPFLTTSNYQEKKITWYTYSISLIGVFVSVILGYQYGLCDMNMVAMKGGVLADYGNKILIHVKKLDLDHICKLILFYVTARVVVLFLYAKMALYVVNNARELQENKIQAEYESKYDKMTGLFSKNEYMKKLEDLYIKLENIGIIYMDVNGLKDINDKYGHEKGDLLICTVADSIKHIIDDNIEAFRIGGDEFILVVQNSNENDISCIVERWRQVLDIMNKTAKNCICEVAVGYAYGAGKDIENIKNSADLKMYENKQKNKKSSIINS